MSSISKHLSRLAGNVLAPVRDPFSRDIAGLPEATATETVELRPGTAFDLRAGPVGKRIGEATVKMLAYNGSIPGPTLKVTQGSEVTIQFTNELELETTVHWHGLRLDNRFDGVPEGAHHGMQPPIPSGGSFTYRLRFPDPGVYWYHPHIQENYTQELGLYGNIIVAPSDPAYWSPVNRELALILDDILMERGEIAPFNPAVGRLGNVMLVNGEPDYMLEANVGEVVRLYLTNTANARTFNFRIPGVRMKLVGSDSGRVEHEEFVEEVLLSSSERAIVDVLFERAGQFSLEHGTPDQTSMLGTVMVNDQLAERSFVREFFTLHTSEELAAERVRSEPDFDRSPDKTLALVRSKLVDRETGRENHNIHWAFSVGDRVKIRIINELHTDHPMPHPIHFHGQRFLVLTRDGVRNENLAWKDTVLLRTGETVDLLLEMTNPGIWMAHCHIAEHLEGGMLLTFQVHEELAGRGYGGTQRISA